MLASSTRSVAVRELQQKLLKSQSTAITQQIIPSGLPTVDAMLPMGGLPTGAVIEWISEYAGVSAATVALQCVRSYLKMPGCLAVVDARHEFHPAILQVSGVPLSRLLLIRPKEMSDGSTASAADRSGTDSSTTSRTSGTPYSAKRAFPSARQSETLWSLEQVARCPGVRIVLCWLDRVSSTALRRLQLAVERSGVTVFLIRPGSALNQPSWADYRLQIGRAPSSLISTRPSSSGTSPGISHGTSHGTSPPSGTLRLPASPVLALRLLRSKVSVQHHGYALLKVDHETGAVCSVSELACSASSPTTAFS